jgi:hypothetical protein
LVYKRYDLYNLELNFDKNKNNLIYPDLNLFDSSDLILKNSSLDDFFLKQIKRSFNTTNNARLLKLPISEKAELNLNSDLIYLFRLRFFKESNNAISNKIMPLSESFSIKQKRYTRRKIISPRITFFKDNLTKTNNTIKYNDSSAINNFVLKNIEFNPSMQYNTFKRKKLTQNTTSVALNKRMLRTKRTLVLPAHVNITAITNSFDVIHS